MLYVELELSLVSKWVTSRDKIVPETGKKVKSSTEIELPLC